MSNVMSNKLVKNNFECQKIVARSLKIISCDIIFWGTDFSKSLVHPRLPKAILLAIGGISGGRITSAIQAYDVRADQWLMVYNNMKYPRTHHKAAFLNGYVYCIGGRTGWSGECGEFLNSVCRLDLVNHTWQEVANMHFRRSNVTVAVLNGFIYAIGGQNEHGHLKSAERYFPKTNQWKRIERMHDWRTGASCATLDGKVCEVR